MWSLETGNREWVRPSLMKRTYEDVHLNSNGYCFDRGAYGLIDVTLTYYHSVVFHPCGQFVLPGTLRSVYTLKGDCTDLFPSSNCTFSYFAFPGDKKTILTDYFDDLKTIVLWSIENGEELKIIESDNVITSFAISQDGSQIAFGDTDHCVHLVDVERWCAKCLFQYSTCGLMHFTPDNKALICGNLHYYSDPEGWVSEDDTKPLFRHCRFKPYQLTKKEFILWPVDPRTLAGEYFLVEGLPSSCVNNVRCVFHLSRQDFTRS